MQLTLGSDSRLFSFRLRASDFKIGTRTLDLASDISSSQFATVCALAALSCPTNVCGFMRDWEFARVLNFSL